MDSAFSYLLAKKMAQAEGLFITRSFYSRSSEYFYKKPVIEARWEDSKTDDRGDFYLSSALAPSEDNLNKLYLYNYIKGAPRNIPVVLTGGLFVSVYTGTTGPSGEKVRIVTRWRSCFYRRCKYHRSFCINRNLFLLVCHNILS